jgi:hypothetical protein
MQVSEASGGAAEDGYVISEQQRSWWVFQPLSNPEVPAIDGADNDIDRFVLAALREAGLEVSPAASRRDLLRRASYDLLGLPPTFEEIQAFGADPAPDAFEHAIDRMLESPHYGERWGRHWLDVVRFGEDDPRGLAEDGTGVERYETAYTYRGWVIEAFNADVPFDRFVKGQLAGDLLPVEERAGMVAGTGFLGGGPWYIRYGRPSSGAR